MCENHRYLYFSDPRGWGVETEPHHTTKLQTNFGTSTISTPSSRLYPSCVPPCPHPPSHSAANIKKLTLVLIAPRSMATRHSRTTIPIVPRRDDQHHRRLPERRPAMAVIVEHGFEHVVSVGTRNAARCRPWLRAQRGARRGCESRL